MWRLLARRISTLLRDLPGRAARLWAGFKADGRAAPLQEIGAYWGAVLGGAGRGVLEEGPAGDPGALAAAALSAPISVEEVTVQLCTLWGSAAAGIDGLGADLLKGAWRWEEGEDGRWWRVNVLAAPLAVAFDRAFRTCYPPAWNVQSLTRLYKGSGPGSDGGNYRPIQVQAALAKLFHKVIHGRVNAFPNSQSKRAHGQAGFHDGRCAADAAFVLHQWNRMAAAESGILRAAFLENLTLAHALRALPCDRDPSRRVWSGAWLHALGWLTAVGGYTGDALREYPILS